MLLDRLDTKRAVAAAARQHDADRVLTAILRQRRKEYVDGRPLAHLPAALAQAKASVLDGQDCRRRQDIYPIRLDRVAVLRRCDRHARMMADDLHKPALALWVQMGYHDKGQAAVRTASR